MDWADFKASWDAGRNWAEVGTWHWLDESLIMWSEKGHRPWLVVADPGSGPNVQLIPRTTTGRGSRAISHSRHEHEEGLEDRRLCRVDRSGWICPSQRRGLPRGLLAGKQFYSCREPDKAVLKTVGCRT